MYPNAGILIDDVGGIHSCFVTGAACFDDFIRRSGFSA